MCIPAIPAIAAVASSVGGVIQTVGTIASVRGALAQGNAEAAAAAQNIGFIERQKLTEARINATEDQRRRGSMFSAIRTQMAELAARGITLDSPSAIMLGQNAAQELSFESQSVRSVGAARTEELTNEQRQIRARGQSGLLRGRYSAASTLLTAGADLWTGLQGRSEAGRTA